MTDGVRKIILLIILSLPAVLHKMDILKDHIEQIRNTFVIILNINQEVLMSIITYCVYGMHIIINCHISLGTMMEALTYGSITDSIR